MVQVSEVLGALTRFRPPDLPEGMLQGDGMPTPEHSQQTPPSLLVHGLRGSNLTRAGSSRAHAECLKVFLPGFSARDGFDSVLPSFPGAPTCHSGAPLGTFPHAGPVPIWL